MLYFQLNANQSYALFSSLFREAQVSNFILYLINPYLSDAAQDNFQKINLLAQHT